MEGASNPWITGDGRVEIDLDDINSILFEIANLLDDWPGARTVVCEPEEKYERLIRTLSGYPEVAVGTLPLDQPMLPASYSAMRCSLFLDDHPGLTDIGSLRMELMVLDRMIRINREKKWLGVVSSKNEWTHPLALLFSSLGVNPQKNPAAEAVCATLVGYDNDGMASINKMTNRIMPEYQELRNRSQSDDSKMHGIKNEMVKCLGQVLTGEHKGIGKRFIRSLQYRNNSMQIQYHRIQDWIHSLFNPDDQRAPSTVQRYIRGASVLLESTASALRIEELNRVGPGAICIDGGGRIRVLTGEKSSQIAFKNHHKRLFEGMFEIDSPVSKRFDEDLRTWRLAQLQLRTPKRQVKKIRKLNAWMTEAGLPARSITIIPSRELRMMDELEADERPEDWGELLSRLDSRSLPIKYMDNDWPVGSKWNPNQRKNQSVKCDVCDNVRGNYRGSKKSTDAVKKVKENSMATKWSNLCPKHRLTYLLGISQRSEDSANSRPTVNDDIHARSTYAGGPNRQVLMVARIDANCVGNLFKCGMKADLDMENGYLQPHHVQRRSIRFGFKWWMSVYKVLNSDQVVSNLPSDTFAAWVLGGDDIVIAAYSSSNTQYAIRNLQLEWKELLNELHTELNNSFAEETPHPVTFCSASAWLDPTGKGDILRLLQTSNELEKKVKRHWRHHHQNQGLPESKLEDAGMEKDRRWRYNEYPTNETDDGWHSLHALTNQRITHSGSPRRNGRSYPWRDDESLRENVDRLMRAGEISKDPRRAWKRLERIELRVERIGRTGKKKTFVILPLKR